MRIVVTAVLLLMVSACTEGPVTPMPRSPTAPSPAPTPTPTPPAPIPFLLTLSVSPQPTASERSWFLASVNGIAPTPPVSYVWNFGDGQTATGAEDQIPHIYGRAGTYLAKVNIRDATSRTAFAELDVRVKAAPEPPPPPPPPQPPPEPSPSLSVTLTASPNPALLRQTVIFTATAIPQNGAGPAVAFEWDFDGNGTYDDITTTGDAMHRYSAIGILTPKVRARTAADVQGIGSTMLVVASTVR